MVFFVAATLCAGSLSAQSPSRSLGLGTAFIVTSQGNSFSFFVPIGLAAKWRLEPELGVRKATLTITQGGNTSKSADRIVSVGTGLLFFFPDHDGTRLYVGPRAGLAWVRSTRDDPFLGSGDSKHTDWFLRVVAGGEHWFASTFSLGGELRFGYTHPGKATTTGAGAAVTQSELGTGAAVFVRWYF